MILFDIIYAVLKRNDMKRVLVICTHNSARSQIAEGLINYYFKDKYKGYSAGTEKTKVNPFAIKAMSEIGIDISHYKSKKVDLFKNKAFDYVITVCDNAQKNCPFFPGKKIIHKSFPDPSSVKGSNEKILAVFCKVRDEIKNWFEKEFILKIV